LTLFIDPLEVLGRLFQLELECKVFEFGGFDGIIDGKEANGAFGAEIKH